MLAEHNSLPPRIPAAEWRSAVLLPLVLTAATIAVHWFSPSKMHLSAAEWDKVYQYHQTLEAFRVRPLTTNLVGAISSVSGATFKTAFISFQFAMFFISCLVFYWYLRQLAFTHRESMAGSGIFHLAVPVFLANFEPIHTWDDFWVYIFVPLSIITLGRRKYLPAAVCMLITILAREINLVLVPVWFWLAYLAENRALLRPLATLATVLAAFAAVRFVLTGASTGDRDINLLFNFDGLLRSRDTIFSLLISNGFVWLTGLWHTKRLWSARQDQERFFSRAALYTTVVYIATGIFFGFARESRYFTVPAIFLVPLTLLFFREYRPVFARLLLMIPRWWHKVAASVMLLGVCVGLTKLAFPRFEYRPWHDGNWGFLALHLGVAIFATAAILIGRSESKERQVRP